MLLIAQTRRQQTDPTGTSGIRRRYEADVRRRFHRLRSDVWQSVAVNDVFGLRDTPRVFQPAPPRAFDFPTDTAKLQAFRRWLQAQIDGGILEVAVRDGSTGQVVLASGWQDLYVRAAYGKGVTDAQRGMQQAGAFVPEIELQGLLRGPVHAERLALLFTRNFTELAGITASMDQALSRVLADGLARGDGPRTIASQMVQEIDISRDRARLMARTETIRAHAQGTLRELSRLGATTVTPMVEFRTTGDIRVCTRCLRLEGEQFTIEEAEGIIPVHPRCRCSWLPSGIGEDPGPRNRRRQRAQTRRRVLATSPAARRGQRDASRGAA